MILYQIAMVITNEQLTNNNFFKELMSAIKTASGDIVDLEKRRQQSGLDLTHNFIQNQLAAANAIWWKYNCRSIDLQDLQDKF